MLTIRTGPEVYALLALPRERPFRARRLSPTNPCKLSMVSMRAGSRWA
jgi:hypothetical protein